MGNAEEAMRGMETREETLSDKIIEFEETERYYLESKDVKDFIKELKEEIKDNFIGENPKKVTIDNVLYYIDKLAGDKLT